MERVLHCPPICPHTSPRLARSSLTPPGSLLPGGANAEMEHSYESSLNHDWHRPNAEGEQFGGGSMGDLERAAQQYSSEDAQIT